MTTAPSGAQTGTAVPSQLIDIDACIRVSSLSSLGFSVEVTRDKEAVYDRLFGSLPTKSKFALPWRTS